MRRMVVSVASSLSTASLVPIQPKSRALATDSRYRPRLVGDVRWAISGTGSSWKLSGGSMLSPTVTKVSKNRHVRRAVRRSARASATLTGNCPAITGDRLAQRAIPGTAAQSAANGRPAVVGGKLAHSAMAGDRIHNAAKGAASSQIEPPPKTAILAAASPSTSAPAMRCMKFHRLRSAPPDACACDTHSSKCSLLTAKR